MEVASVCPALSADSHKPGVVLRTLYDPHGCLQYASLPPSLTFNTFLSPSAAELATKVCFETCALMHRLAQNPILWIVSRERLQNLIDRFRRIFCPCRAPLIPIFMHAVSYSTPLAICNNTCTCPRARKSITVHAQKSIDSRRWQQQQLQQCNAADESQQPGFELPELPPDLPALAARQLACHYAPDRSTIDQPIHLSTTVLSQPPPLLCPPPTQQQSLHQLEQQQLQQQLQQQQQQQQLEGAVQVHCRDSTGFVSVKPGLILKIFVALDTYRQAVLDVSCDPMLIDANAAKIELLVNNYLFLLHQLPTGAVLH